MEALKCSCGQLSRLVKFSTFEYQYCDACKTEVKEQLKLKVNHCQSLVDELAALHWGNALTSLQQQVNKAASNITAKPAVGSGGSGASLTPAAPNIVAVKGEWLTCSVCNRRSVRLVGDLHDLVTRHSSGIGIYPSGKTPSCFCGVPADIRYNQASNNYEYHHEILGWV